MWVLNGEFENKSYKIIKKNSLWGMANKSGKLILNVEYHNIFCVSQNIFAVVKNGKVGLVTANEQGVSFLIYCKYNMIHTCGTVIFLYGGNPYTEAFNTAKNIVYKFTNVMCDSTYLLCSSQEKTYIINAVNGDEIYTVKNGGIQNSFLEFAGNSKNGAVFFDRRYSCGIYPRNAEYSAHKYIVLTPVTVNNQNLCAITQGDNGIGVIDCKGDKIFDNVYDSVNIKLVVSGQKSNKTEKKIIPFRTISKKGKI